MVVKIKRIFWSGDVKAINKVITKPKELIQIEPKPTLWQRLFNKKKLKKVPNLYSVNEDIRNNIKIKTANMKESEKRLKLYVETLSITDKTSKETVKYLRQSIKVQKMVINTYNQEIKALETVLKEHGQ